MDFERLYSEYESAIKRQKTVIKEYLDKLKTATESSNYQKVCQINKMLCTLYTEKNELEQSAVQIKSYITN